MNVNDKKSAIDIKEIAKTMFARKKTYFKVWAVVFVLSCIWIFPQPRYYNCEVAIAPETAEASVGGGLASLASSFGVNIGNMSSSDAIFPELYPDLFESNEFLVDLLDIKVTTKKNDLTTDYYDYLMNHQKENVLLMPFIWTSEKLRKMFSTPEKPIKGKNGKRFDPFRLNKDVHEIIEQVATNIDCNYSKTTGVVTISVTDQDPVVCALLADSVKEHLQNFITEYRTKKARIDYEHYKQLTADAKCQYEKARQAYGRYSDAEMDVVLESYKSKQEDMENEMQLRYNVYTALNTRLEAALAKVQEKTPAFTTLKCASVPIKPAGPKRIVFVVSMLILSTIVTFCNMFRKELMEWF